MAKLVLKKLMLIKTKSDEEYAIVTIKMEIVKGWKRAITTTSLRGCVFRDEFSKENVYV